MLAGASISKTRQQRQRAFIAAEAVSSPLSAQPPSLSSSADRRSTPACRRSRSTRAPPPRKKPSAAETSSTRAPPPPRPARYTMGGSDDDEDAGTGAGDYVKSLVFGGLDGIITTFAIVRGHPSVVRGGIDGYRLEMAKK